MSCLSSIVGFSELEKNFNVTVKIGSLRLSHIFLLSILSMVPSVWPVFGFIFSTRDLRRNQQIWWRVCTTFNDVIITSKVPSCQVAIYWIVKIHSMDLGLFYGTFYVEVGNFSGPKLEGKNTTAWYFRWRKKEKIFFGKRASFVACILGSKSTQKSTWLLWPFYLRRTVIPSKKTRGWYHPFYLQRTVIPFAKKTAWIPNRQFWYLTMVKAQPLRSLA